jgi:hypothetical protein
VMARHLAAPGLAAKHQRLLCSFIERNYRQSELAEGHAWPRLDPAPATKIREDPGHAPGFSFFAGRSRFARLPGDGHPGLGLAQISVRILSLDADHHFGSAVHGPRRRQSCMTESLVVQG